MSNQEELGVPENNEPYEEAKGKEAQSNPSDEEDWNEFPDTLNK